VPGQRRLQVIDLFGQYGVDDCLADRLLAGLVSGLERERQRLMRYRCGEPARGRALLGCSTDAGGRLQRHKPGLRLG
jgi:hypothetical protein